MIIKYRKLLKIILNNYKMLLIKILELILNYQYLLIHIIMIVETNGEIINKDIKKTLSPEDKKKLFLEGLEIIFRNWTALRMLMDSNGAYIYNTVQEVLNDKEEIVEELDFNISIGTIYEEICTILVSRSSL
jgi:hypothetical protein